MVASGGYALFALFWCCSSSRTNQARHAHRYVKQQHGTPHYAGSAFVPAVGVPSRLGPQSHVSHRHAPVLSKLSMKQDGIGRREVLQLGALGVLASRKLTRFANLQRQPAVGALTDVQKARLNAMDGAKDLMKDLTPAQRLQVLDLTGAWMTGCARALDIKKDLTPKMRQDIIDRASVRMSEMSDTMDRMKDLTPEQRQAALIENGFISQSADASPEGNVGITIVKFMKQTALDVEESKVQDPNEMSDALDLRKDLTPEQRQQDIDANYFATDRMRGRMEDLKSKQRKEVMFGNGMLVENGLDVKYLELNTQKVMKQIVLDQQ